MWSFALLALISLGSSSNRPKDLDFNKNDQRLKTITVKELYIYPVKSCAAIKVDSAFVSIYGFEFDRLWVVGSPDGSKFRTQRDYPALALIKQQLLFDSPDERLKPGAYSRGRGRLVLSAPGKKDLSIPFRKYVTLQKAEAKTGIRSFDGLKATNVPIWNNNVDGIDEGDEAAKWLTEFLGVPCRLFVKDPRTVRTLSERHTPSREAYAHDPQTAFADGFPFLIASTSSLEDTNQHLAKHAKPIEPPLKPINFRPNILVDCAIPYNEEHWKQITINEHLFYVASRCTRCSMPGVNPDKGTASNPEVSKAMSKFRRTDPGSKYEICFGMNASSKEVGFKVSVGEKVNIKEFGVHDNKKGLWRPRT